MDINQRIEEILADLYRIEPAFQSQEPKLKKLLAELLAIRPEVELNEEFVATLRHQLLAAAREMAAEQPQQVPWFRTLVFRWAGSVAVVAIAIGLGFYYYGHRPEGGDLAAQNLLASRVEIHAVGAAAFGNLSDLQVANGRGGGGAGEAAASDSASLLAPKGMGGGGIYEPVTYKYVYKGDELTAPDAQMDVYKREKGLPAGLDAALILKKLDFGLFDAGSFGSLRVDSLSLSEDRDFGYSVYISLQDGMVSVGQNWPKWPTMDKLCQGQGESCFRDNQLKYSDMPADDAVIKLADDFLSAHNISKESYGEPFVNKYWQEEYEHAQDKSTVYLPDTVSVVYPLKMNGKETYDEGGTRVGLNVNVDVRHMKAAGVNELTSQRYQSSSYSTETDTSKLLGIAEKGGYHGGYYNMGGKTIEITLGTPTLSYVKVWQYETSVTNELLVPALIFPVTSTDTAEPMYRKNVVVPVIKEIIEKDESQNQGGPIHILREVQ